MCTKCVGIPTPNSPTFTFDLQLFGGGSGKGGQQYNQADSYYQSEASNANQLMQQFNQLYLPQLQKLLPELQGTLQGQNTPLTQAAQAPVNQATSHALNTIQGNAGGVANPAALYEDIALGGQQNAALAGDANLQSSLAALQNLIGLGYGGVNTAQQSLQGAGGGETNLGSAIGQTANAPWEALLGAAGQYAAMSAGAPPGVTPSGPQGLPKGVSTTPVVTAGNSYFGGLTSANATPFGTSGFATSSAPISGGSGGPSPFNPYGFNNGG